MNYYWSYGITTVYSRVNDLFPRTLESLVSTGFDAPRIFVDGCKFEQAIQDYRKFGLPITIRDPIRTAGHWVLTALELYIRDPAAEYFAIFQDDVVFVRNLRKFLESHKLPANGYYNLYTVPHNQKRIDSSYRGWFESNQEGKGALALVFSNEALRLLLGQNYLINRFQDKIRGHKAIDGGIVDAMKQVEWKEYVHSPSLVQHIGDVSSMGNTLKAKATSFPGEEFDALTLLS